MAIVVGTSGWQYRDWRGVLYPERLPASRWLEHFATSFPAVEVNNTFYRLPREDTFADWRARTPEGFVFVVKASRYITHIRKLADVVEPVTVFLERATKLAGKLGAVLYQLPPSMRRDDDLLRRFLDVVPAHPPSAIEFRDPSWEEQAVFDILTERGIALCIADSSKHTTPLVATAPWAYVRMHGRDEVTRYSASEIQTWAERIASLRRDRVFVFFNNDSGGAAVHDARALTSRLRSIGVPVQDPTAA